MFDPPSSNSECTSNIYPGGGDVAEHLPTPPLDFAMLIDDFALPENFTFGFSSNEVLEFNLEDLEFIDDLHFDPGPGSNCVSSDHHSYLRQLLPDANPDNKSFSASPEAKVFTLGTVDQGLNADMASNFGITWDSDPPIAYDTQLANCERYSSGRASNNQAPGSKFTPKVDCPSPASGDCDQLSSQGSGEFNSGICPVGNPSPDSCQSARLFLSSSDSSISKAENSSTNGLAESRIKIEEVGSKCTPKRKKGQDDEGSAETRTSKLIRPSLALESASIDPSTGNVVDDKKARLTRNRESAYLSRQRKKQYVEVLEDKVKFMHSTITDLKSKVSYIIAENATLRQQLSGGGFCPPPPPGMYPIAPMGYPWMPCPAYVVKPHGSRVPLVPIPRLKPQHPASASKASKKSENKKNVRKTKKVASVSFLGLLFFILLFGGLFPIVHVKYGDKLSVADNLHTKGG